MSIPYGLNPTIFGGLEIFLFLCGRAMLSWFGDRFDIRVD
jgi:hypothetical protein